MTIITAKQRLLELMEILRTKTDEENELSFRQIKDLMEQRLSAEVGESGLQTDLKELINSRYFDVTVNYEGNGLSKYYSHQFRQFEINELRLLIDAVSSARFINNEKTEKLIGKIKRLTSENLAEQLKNEVVVNDTVTSDNKRINTYIHFIHQAITEGSTITFQYGRYNTKKEFILSRDGDRYELKPYALLWNNDFYYLIGKYGPDEEVRHYRVDRMREVVKTDVSFTIDREFNLSEYANQLFHMYSGDAQYVEIVFDNQLINVIIDRFGLDVNIYKHDETSFKLLTKAVISEGLVRWILTWGSDAKVLKPEALVEKIAEEAEKMYRNYQRELS